MKMAEELARARQALDEAKSQVEESRRALKEAERDRYEKASELARLVARETDPRFVVGATLYKNHSRGGRAPVWRRWKVVSFGPSRYYYMMWLEAQCVAIRADGSEGSATLSIRIEAACLDPPEGSPWHEKEVKS